MVATIDSADAQQGGSINAATAVGIARSYLTPQLQTQSAMAISSAVRDHVGALLARGRGASFAAAASPLLGYAAPARNDGGDGLSAFAAAAATPQWSLWFAGSSTWSDRDDAIAGNEGRLDNGNIGLDHRVGQRAVIGVIGSLEHGDYDVTLTQGTLRNRAAGGGVYGGYALTDIWVVDALVQWQSLDGEVTGGSGSGSYGGDRVQLSANITGYFTQGDFHIRPTAGISFTRDNERGFTTTTGAFTQTTRTTTTTGSAGVHVGRAFNFGQGRSIEPWLGVTVSLDSIVTKPPPAVPGHALDPFDVTAAGGLNAKLSNRVSLTAKTEIGGLARGDYSTILAGGTFSLEF